MFASLLYTQRERPTKSQASSTSVAFSILPFRLIFSVNPLIFQTQVSPHIYPPRILLFSEVFAYTKSTRVDGEWKHFQHHVCSCFLLYTCAEMGDPVKRGKRHNQNTQHLCECVRRPTIYKYKRYSLYYS